MAKTVTHFVCQECGYESPAFLGKCPECGMWNTLREFKIINTKSKIQGMNSQEGLVLQDPQMLKDISVTDQDRLHTGFLEMDGVLGGGFVKGSVTLIAGDPGIGKSTLLLQFALSVAQGPIPHKVFYVSAEESAEQIKMRAMRIAPEDNTLFILSISNVDAIITRIIDNKPNLVIVDSIQTIESEQVSGLSGSIAQIRFAAMQLIRVAKQLNIPIIIVGHVTKEGMVAGPMILSHMVDTVLFLEGEKFTKTRILRSLKNRFGPIDEVGIFLMSENGMKEVQNPEQIFLSRESIQIPGSVLVVIMEGSRPFLLEIQALVVASKFPMPRRVASGVDSRRLELLLAVLQKHCHLPLESMDVFINLAGGMRVTDTAVDLGICLAIFSSLKNITLSETVGIAEVGLLGELREVGDLDKRIKEAKKLGFKKIITAKTHKSLMKALQNVIN